MKFVVRHGEETPLINVERHGQGYRVQYDGRELIVDLVAANAFLQSLRFEDGRQFLLGHHHEGSQHQVSFGDKTILLEIFDPLSLKRRRREDEAGAGGGALKALMPGRVVRIMVEEGAAVQKGEGLLILEAMKMENEITAPMAGTVTKIAVTAGQSVDGGADLLTIE
jgi:biotin carboxyl carrier protein